MPTKTLTDAVTKRKPPASGTVEIWDTVVPGLHLRIHAGGRRTYSVMTRLAPSGRQIRRRLGTTDSLTLAEARDEARAVIKDAARGIDSAGKATRVEAARQAQRELERANANTFRSVAEAYLGDTGRHGAGGRKSRHLIERSLENHAMPRFGDRAIGDILRSEVKDVLRELVAAGQPIAANRLLGYLKRVFRWAVEADKIAASPVADLDRPAAERSRDRVLTDGELAEIWRACGELSKAHGGAIRLMILTGARRTEAGGLLRSEISNDGLTWTLPAARSKNGRAHLVPLAELARDVIADVPEIKSDKDATEHVFTLDGKRAVNGWSKIKVRLDRKIAEARAKAAGVKLDMDKHAMSGWTLHDLRRTLVTGMIETLGIAPHVVEAVVNHVSGSARAGVAGTYNRSVLLPQRREALEAWARHIEALVAGKAAPSNVTRLTEHA